MLRCVVRLLYGAGRVPRHDLEQGNVDSAKGRLSTASCWPACGRKRIRTGSSSYFSAEEVSWLGWAATWAMVLGCQGGLLLGWGGPRGKPPFFS
jgi:hypothetical protein